jgi:hypothetical protein
MFRLVRWLTSLAVFAIVAWFAINVPLGKRTLWGHLRAIISTQEAKDLAEGTREEAERVARRVKDELRKDATPGEEPLAPKRGPLEKLTDHDRESLDHLVKDKAGASDTPAVTPRARGSEKRDRAHAGAAHSPAPSP